MVQKLGFLWKDHAVRAGALTMLVEGVVKYYQLTPLGAKLLSSSTGFTMGEGGFGVVHVLEDQAVKFEIAKDEDAGTIVNAYQRPTLRAIFRLCFQIVWLLRSHAERSEL